MSRRSARRQGLKAAPIDPDAGGKRTHVDWDAPSGVEGLSLQALLEREVKARHAPDRAALAREIKNDFECFTMSQGAISKRIEIKIHDKAAATIAAPRAIPTAAAPRRAAAPLAATTAVPAARAADARVAAALRAFYPFLKAVQGHDLQAVRTTVASIGESPELKSSILEIAQAGGLEQHVLQQESFGNLFYGSFEVEFGGISKSFVRKPVLFVGRARSMDVQIDDMAVSNVHCMLILSSSTITVMDAWSTLGTRGPSDYSSPGDRVPLFGSASADFSFFLGPNETFPKVTIRVH